MDSSQEESEEAKSAQKPDKTLLKKRKILDDSDESIDFSAKSENSEAKLDLKTKNPETIFRDKEGKQFDLEDDREFKLHEIQKLNEKIVKMTS